MDRSRGSDSKSTKISPRKKMSMSEGRKEDINDAGFVLLANPNVSEEHQSSPTKSLSFNTLTLSDSKERLSPSKTGKNRSKSPSFFKMLVNRGLRKISTNELEDSEGIVTRGVTVGDSSSFSDNDEPISFSPIVLDNERQRIDHIATLPRRNSAPKRLNNGRKVTRSFSDEHYCSSSPEDNAIETYDKVRDEQIEGVDQIDTDCYQSIPHTPSSTYQPTAYHSVGIEALEMLHNQLQILVIQDCDSEMADLMQEQVTDSLKKQIFVLQESVSYLQQSDQNLRLSLKMAEMRAQEAETKLHHSSQRGIKMEEMYYRLEKEYNKMFQNYCTVEKILQKQAVLHQMQLSPNKKFERRPNLATHNRRQKSFDNSHSPRLNPVKRHNSSEFLSHHQRNRSLTKSIDQSLLATADINPCNTLPTRLHSGSLSHTETRV